MTKIMLLHAALLSLLLTGCVSDEANRFYGDSYPATAVENVEVLTGAPTRSYQVLADFQSRGDTEDSLRRKAAEIGADAIIISKLGGFYSESENWAGADRHSDSYSRIVGTAIKYK